MVTLKIRFCQEQVHHCLPCGWEWRGRVTASVLRAEINHSVLSKPSFPWKLQAFSRLQTSKIVPSNKFHPFSFCLGGEIESLSAFYFAIVPWSFGQSCPTLCDPTDSSPPPMGFSRQEYWRGVPLPSPEKLARGIQRQI